ncbi:MAG: ABC transporter ATP-binding protein [Bacillota bacterium]|nr:ABC transporter ATP-binding protein [Bacillota bacterium]
MTKTAIEAKGLTKTYKNKTAVDDLSFTIDQGELFALLGVNGAGKSTTIKILSCLTKADKGDALLLGNSVTKDSLKVKELISVSPQETAVAANLTVRENLELMAGVYGYRPKEAKTKAEDIIQSFGMADIAKNKAKTLSGGWQRRLSIAMALISDPQILFLDEPTLGLDVLARRELWRTIEKLKGHVTMILTTHYLEEAEALADRIAIMTNGRLEAVGTAEELKAVASKDSFEEAFIALAEKGGSLI